MPYSVNRATYAVAPFFIFQSPRPEPAYRHAQLREFYTGWEVNAFLTARSKRGFLFLTVNKILTVWSFFLGPVLTVPFLASLWTWKSRRTRTLLFLAACSAIASALVPFFVPHYVAPAAVVIYALVLQGMRQLYASAPRMARAVPLVCVLMVAVRLGMAAAAIPLAPEWPMTWARPWPSHVHREKLADEIRAQGGQHLVIVRYVTYTADQYVYNDADIDASPIVWAQDMGPVKNAELLHYFGSRKVWLLSVDGDSRALSPYNLFEGGR
jgi:hypothetical protein